MKNTIMKLFFALSIAASMIVQCNAVDASNEHNEEQQAQVVRVDVYKFKMRLKTPRVYDNMQSLGYRKYQYQTIQGPMMLVWREGQTAPDIEFGALTNKTHKLSNGQNVIYDAALDEYSHFPRVYVIGSNKTLKFNTAAVNFNVIAEPVSYAVWDKVDEDNSLYISLAGIGKVAKRKGSLKLASVSGNVVGTLGCGCVAYGHTSPTRMLGLFGPELDRVVDVAAVYGSWQAIYKESK